MKKIVIRIASFNAILKLFIPCLFMLFCVQMNAQVYNKPISAFPDYPADAIYQNTQESPEKRAMDVVERLSFDEILRMTGGEKRFYMPGIPRLGLRPIYLSDASQGVHLRQEIIKEARSTSFPGTVSLASTWNKDLAYQMGVTMGKECRALGIDVLLGPGINLQRFSTSGRNYEYMGEDPLLTGLIAANYVKGLQSKNVVATAKHFVGNDQEFCRHIASSDIDERTLRELYLKPFEMAIKEGGLKGMMTGNNGLNGVPCCLDKQVVNDIVRDEFGFDGIIMTDWQNTGYFPSLQYLYPNAGVSLLMPANTTFAAYIKSYLKQYPAKKDEIKELLKKKVYTNLKTLFEMGAYDREVRDHKLFNNLESHKEIARKIAEEGIALLKNKNNILPIKKGTQVLLMGDDEIHSGDGSGFVEGYDHTSFEQGLQKEYGAKNITVLKSWNKKAIVNADVIIYRLNKYSREGFDVPFEVGLDSTILKVAEVNPNVVVAISSCNPLPMPWHDDVDGILWCYYLGQERGNAFANIVSGKVNPSGKLPFTIEKDFADSQDSTYNYFGDEPFWGGRNPHYKEYWKGNKDAETLTDNFKEYVKFNEIVRVPYSEGVLMGYRWYDTKNIDVRYPFGYGLSYTNFSYSNIELSKTFITDKDEIEVKVTVTNTGEVAGAEVVQLYISDLDCGVQRPKQELKNFEKIYLKSGESRTISFTIIQQDLSFWDVDNKCWAVERGEFSIRIGGSSRNIQLSKSFQLML